MHLIKLFNENILQNRKRIVIFCILIFVIMHFILQQMLLYRSSEDPPITTKVQYLYKINDLLLSIPKIQQNQKPKNFALENDFSTLLNLNDFNFTINQKQCGGDDNNLENKLPFTLILIHSAPNNFNERNVIRETWGGQLSSNTQQFRLIFLLGKIQTSATSTQLQNQIEAENVIYQDIVQGNFIDTYYNLTYKHIMAFKWFTYYCSNANYLLKTDDDVFINAQMFHPFINAIGNRQMLFCRERVKDRVARSPQSKWYINETMYKDIYWPNYCTGFTILYSSDIILKLYNTAQTYELFPFDDVFVTGFLREQIKLQITTFETFFINEQIVNDLINRKRNITNTYFLFSEPKHLNELKIRALWQLTTLK